MTTPNPAEFVRQVREEARKVVWPTRRETLISTVMVLVLVFLAAVFFVFVDWIAGGLIRTIIGI